MHRKQVSFKKKILIPTMIIYVASILIISVIYFNQIDRVVTNRTKETLDIFTGSIFTSINHLEIILNTTKQTLSDKHIAIAKTVSDILGSTTNSTRQGIEDLSAQSLQRFALHLDIDEINIADSDGIVKYSNIPGLIGYDFNANEMTIKYMALTDGTSTEITEEPRQSILPDNSLGGITHFAAVPREGGGFIQLGFNAAVLAKLQEEININVTIKETRLGENGYGFVLYNGLIRAHPDLTIHGKDVSGEDWYKSINSGNGFAWINIDGFKFYAGYRNKGGNTVVGLIPAAEYNSVRNQALLETVLFIAAAFVVMLTVIYLIVSRLTAGINSLVACIGKIANGNLDAKIEERYNDEFDLIKDAVNSMAENLKTHIKGEIQAEREVYKALSEKKAMEHELTQSKISTMLSQIQPHFMYNTLAVIKHLCETDPQTAKETIIEFSNYLRGNIDSLSQVELIPFDKELTHTETYLKIEKKRFDDMLNINYDIKVRDFYLPALTLQPIVENAVRYGVTKKDDGGTVNISTEETDYNFLITITDDGVGFDMQNQYTQNDRRHIGIENVRNRIFSMCGGTINIQSKPGEGTIAVISIPKRGVTENDR